VDAKDYRVWSVGIYERTRARLEGRTDDEHLWEPAPDCWTVRERTPGRWQADWSVMPVVPPFTTMAWRLVHLAQCYGEERNARMLGLSLSADGAFQPLAEAPSSAAAALDRLDAAAAHWHTMLEACTDEHLVQPIGPIGGPYAEEPRAGFVVHMIDEQTHHGAEVGLLRDLYRAQHAPPYPRSLVRAVRDGFADKVLELLEDPSVDVDEIDPELGAAALHFACGAGDHALVERLLARGASTSHRDARFDADPAGWAEFFGHAEVADLVRRAS
jgi:uncharacterized damage-inducible protein DinB